MVKSFVGSLTNMGYRTIHENFIEYNVIRRSAHRRRRFPGPSSLKAEGCNRLDGGTGESGVSPRHREMSDSTSCDFSTLFAPWNSRDPAVSFLPFSSRSSGAKRRREILLERSNGVVVGEVGTVYGKQDALTVLAVPLPCNVSMLFRCSPLTERLRSRVPGSV
jgi:hypothetical protein